jgi:hypothetical protein
LSNETKQFTAPENAGDETVLDFDSTSGDRIDMVTASDGGADSDRGLGYSGPESGAISIG